MRIAKERLRNLFQKLNLNLRMPEPDRPWQIWTAILQLVAGSFALHVLHGVVFLFWETCPMTISVLTGPIRGDVWRAIARLPRLACFLPVIRSQAPPGSLSSC